MATIAKEKTAAEAPQGVTPPPGARPARKKAEVKYSVSPGFVGFLAAQDAALAFTSYQSGKFYLLGRNPAGGLMVHERFFQKAMGIAVAGRDTLYLATLMQIVRFENVLRGGQKINNVYDVCYAPRASHLTGALDAHDVGIMADGRPVFVNTAYNCLATLSDRHSFTPLWRPPFVSKLVKEDRCHLNGLAMDNGAPAYVTAASRSDTIDGWRDRRQDGGVVIDVRTGEVVAEGLSMPHSPRVHQGKLWVLNSGAGELGWIDLDKPPAEAFQKVAFCPGFARGLALHGRFAVVGLSKPRYERFEGLALDDRLKETDSEPWCGIQVIDLETGACAHWFRIDGAIGELYDIGVIPGAPCPMALGFTGPEILSLITHDEEAAEA